jgi:YidC/Oxa1 family membrane protein insertase
MFSFIWHTFFFDPVYNSLVLFISVIPNGDVGLAIIATVILVKTILLPLSIKAAKTQRIMREIEPKLKAIKETHKDNREEQAKAMMQIYKEADINPFASISLLFLQIPIVIALYFAVSKGGGVALPEINIDALYAIIKVPEFISMNFLGLIDITQKSIALAVGAGIAQFIYTGMTLPKLAEREPDAAPNMKDDFMRNMHIQMKYVMPVIIAVVAYTISAAIALYFLVSNVVAILQEYFVKKHR